MAPGPWRNSPRTRPSTGARSRNAFSSTGCFPIWRDRAKLGWTHYRLLVQVADAAQRKALEAAAIKHDWTSTELETRVRSFNAVALADDDEPTTTPEKPIELLKPRCGIAGLRRLVDRPEGLSIDLGFKNYAAVPFATKSKTQSKVEGLRAGPSTQLRAGDIVEYGVDPTRSTELRAGPDIRVVDASQNQLFTYRATIRKIVDGDTLDITLTLAPGFTRDLKLRLRGIDSPEMDTAAGRAAKAFVAKLLAPGDKVIVCTTKPDKYDRYLADVFVAADATKLPAPQLSTFNAQPSATGTAVFLNNALLIAGHAVPYDGGTK